MYPIQSDLKALFDAEKTKSLRITGTDANGTTISITDANVMQNGFVIDRYSCNGDKLEIGTAIASELTLRLDNRQGQFDGIVFGGTELFVEIGIDGDYIPCGYFTPDIQPRSMSVISINALDRMTRFDAASPTLMAWVDNNGNQIVDNNGNKIFFSVSLVFPCTVADLVSEICTRCDVPLGTDLSDLPNAGYTIAAMPDLQAPITYRNMIQWCAGIMGTNAYINWDGELCFAWYDNDSGHTLTTANRFESDLYEDDITITGVTFTDTANNSFISGTDEYTIELTGNYLAAGGAAQIVANIGAEINGFVYRPFSAKVVAAPYLWPMDTVEFIDREGASHTCVLTNVNFTLNGTTSLEGKGETAESNNRQNSDGAFTTQQAVAVQRVAQAVSELDESLTQDEIFNRLTNGGEDQGIYLHDGKVYINADYIVAGIIRAMNGRSHWNLNDGKFYMNGGEIDLRADIGDAGFSVGRYGDLAIGQKPENMSSFENNFCGFQVDNGGNVKAYKLNLYGPVTDGNTYTRIGAIVAAAPEGGVSYNDADGYRKIFLTRDGVELSGTVHAKNGFGFTGGITVNPDNNPKQGINTTFRSQDGYTITVTDGIITGKTL